MKDLQFYLSTHEAWEAIYADCVGAKHSIECEQYIVTDGGIGTRLMELFCQKAERQVRVRIMLDRVGSRKMISSELVKQLASSGGEVYFYNHLGWYHLWQPWLWFPRDHVKTMLIDSKVGYTGGVCFDQKMAGWRDTQVRFTRRDVIRQVRNDFDHLWRRFSGEHNVFPRYPTLLDAHCRYVVSMPGKRGSAIYNELKVVISQARELIYLTSPYFIPDNTFMRLLKNAAARGVEVILLVTHNSDNSMVDHASRSYFSTVLRHGIQVFLYEKELLHAKSIVVDNNWATVGSANLDYLSFYRNREANLIIRDKRTVNQMREHFFEDLRHSHEITIEEWDKRPLGDRLKAFLCRCVSRYL